MTKSTLIKGFLAALMLTGVAGPALAEVKIGYVNAIQVLEQAPQAAQARETLQREFADRDRKLVASQRELQSLQGKLEKDAAVMSEAERSKLQREILSKQRDLQRDQEEFREDVNLRRNEEFGRIQQDIVSAIQQVAKEQKYDLVVGEGVIFASDRINMTDAVVEKLKSGN